jgi:hypothetical protein
MTHHGLFARARRAAGVLAGLVALAALPGAAQQTVNGYPVGPDGEPVANPPRNRLAAGRDAAVSDLRSAGYFTRVCAENSTGAFDIDRAGCAPFFQTMNNGFVAVWPREGHWAWGTTKTTWDSAVAKVPSLANAIGGGWTVINSHQTGFDDLRAADNGLGLHHAGAVTVNDRSCVDHRTSYGSGNPLLAGSNCPVTWGTEGWKGARPVPTEVYEARYAAQGNNFNFDFWRVSDAELDAAGITPPTAANAGKTLGNFQTYGYTSDHSVETLCGTSTVRNYAHIIPTTSVVAPGGCVGSDPARRRPGWPLGIEVRFDAFTFQLPALKEVQYYQVTFTNRSRDVYGVPLDYDSVYISLQNGWFGNSNIQQNPTWWVPSMGALFTSALPISGPCNAARIVSDLTCARWGTNFGFVQGASAVIVLKSPIGDLRNKWFSRVGSPFYNPAHPLAGDTLTYMHGHLCGFRNCGNTTYASNPATTPDHEQRGFGMLSSTEANVFGARTPASLTSNQYWHTFRNFNWNSTNTYTRWAPGQALAVGGGFSRWAPNMAGINWDWGGPPGSMNPKDGIQDTMAVDGCRLNGCAALWGDTLPNGFYSAYSNTHGVLGVGPIRLMADSVVSFVVALTVGQANDSAGLMAQVAAAIDNYMNFYLAPDAAPKCRMAGVTRATAAEGTSVGLAWDNSCFNGVWTDKFLDKQYNDLINALANSPNSLLWRLGRLNPWLDDTLNYLRNNNLRRLYIFKSCNDGGVWTTGDDCIEGSPATGGALSALGWQPYVTYDPDQAAIPTSYTDLNVRNGQTYTYNLIGETRGANFSVLVGDSVDAATNLCMRNCRVEPLNLAPVLFNTLSSSTGEVNVARAYLPVSLQAGGSRSLATVTASTGPMNASRLGIVVTNDSLAAAQYRVLFADSVANATFTLRYDRDSTYLRGTETALYLWHKGATSDTVLGTNSGGFTNSGGTAGAPSIVLTTDDSLIVTPYSWGTAPVLALTRFVTNAAVDALLVSTTLTGAATTPAAFHANADYPKFDLSINAGLANAFNTQAFLNSDGSTVPPLVTPTISWQNAMALQNAATAQTQNEANGDYTITWQAQAFGAGGRGGSDQFVIDFSNPSASAAVITASINARTAVMTGSISDTAAAAVQAATGLVTSVDSLVAVRLPFRVRNVSYNRDVTIAMRVRPAAGKTILIGVGGDTLRLSVPADAWVPGDTLYFIEAVGATGTPAVTFQRAVIACAGGSSCNPIYPGTRGASVYLSPAPGQQNTLSYHTPVTSASAFTITATAPARGAALTSQSAAIRAGLANVRVVPNPYVMISQYAGNNLLFTHMPPRGILRIYTVAGQFVQQITWTEANLRGDGDLAWNLRTREGNLMGAGLYIYVLTATDASGATIGTRTDKFVVIR